MKKLEHERCTKITPRDIVQFESSEIVRKAIKIIGESYKTKKCSQTEFVLVRDLFSHY